MSSLKFEPIQPWIGAEVQGVDLREPLSPDTLRELRAAWEKYRVLVFRDQELTHEQHKAFAAAFGTLEVHPALGLPEHPEIVPIQIKPGMALERQLQDWHTDVTYMERPPGGAFLYAHVIPSIGGDTAFVNTVKAFEKLDESMKERLRGLRAIHAPDFENYINDPERLRELHAKNPPIEHPVVIEHPTTGEECLYVNEHFTRSIVGLSESDSRSLLQQLYHHLLTHPEFQMRVRWQRHTLVMWDERATQHYAVTDYDEPRYLERVMIAGERPRASTRGKVAQQRPVAIAASR
jgi:taurine dioxygenase